MIDGVLILPQPQRLALLDCNAAIGNVINLNIHSESSTTLLLSQKRVRVDVCSKKFECSKVDCRSLLTMSAPQSMLNAPFHGNVIGR